MSDVKNLSDTIIPKSDQLNAEQLLGGPVTVTVTNIRRGEPDQPVVIGYAGDDGRPYKPCKTMRKVLIFAWGEDGGGWIGRSMTLYCDQSVMFGGVKVGGIRISHLSHIDRDISVSLTKTRGKKEPITIKRLDVNRSASDDARDAVKAAAKNGTPALQAAWQALTGDDRKQLGAAFIAEQKAIASAVPDPAPEDEQAQGKAEAASVEPESVDPVEEIF